VIEVYAFSTPNSVRVPIALEELGLDYELKPVNVKARAVAHVTALVPPS
jgi:glutathione S-transferase